MFSYRFCFYAIHSAPWVLGVVWLMNVLLNLSQSWGGTSFVEGVFIVLLVGYVLVGLVLGVKLMRGSLVLLCPFCSRPGPARLDRSEGLGMDCTACGEIRGGGLLGWKIVRDREEPCRGVRPVVPVDRMQHRSPWFWALFGLSVVSAVAGVVIHEFNFFTVFAPLWCFVVAGFLVQALSTGCLNDNAGPTFRSRQPLKYWLRTCIWLCGYGLAVCMPIAYALQEREKPEVEANTKTEARDAGKAALKAEMKK